MLEELRGKPKSGSAYKKMPLCCVGGVHVPYSALLPFLLYGLKWIVENLSEYGLIPSWVVKKLNQWTGGVMFNERPKQGQSCCLQNGKEEEKKTQNDSPSKEQPLEGEKVDANKREVDLNHRRKKHDHSLVVK
jgi:hypothetical protein